MSPSELRDKMAARASMVASLLTVSDCPDTPIVNHTLNDIGHHLTMLERLVGRLNGKVETWEARPF